ncbi:MAG: MoxR family ATPase [Victivallales bacterium]|nr:MoxR family ATPase [Victivallales bacterium]
MAVDVNQIGSRVAAESQLLNDIRHAVGRVIVGQEELVQRLLIALVTGNHVLIEGVPGLAKTLTVTSLAQAMSACFHRIQFTPDLLPADLIGTLIYNPKSGDFTTRRGPVFANLVLADEINRAPAKVQSALLEAMQERQVTIGEESYALPRPFLVMATQNPVEQEGTYQLPEAQVDRFLFKLKVGYPTPAEELEILQRHSTPAAESPVSPVVTPEDLIRIGSLAGEIFMDRKIQEYIVAITACTRNPEAYGLGELRSFIRYGASPRASIGLCQAARAQALMEGRGYTTPQDVKSVAFDVLRHRVILTYEAEAEEITSEEIVRKILDTVPVP